MKADKLVVRDRWQATEADMDEGQVEIECNRHSGAFWMHNRRNHASYVIVEESAGPTWAFSVVALFDVFIIFDSENLHFYYI